MTTASTIGFIGLGVMGKPMARNLLVAGYEVVVANRSPAKVRELEDDGAAGAASPADVAKRADVVITCLPDSPDVEAVVLGDGGVLSAAREGLLLIDASTVKPDTARTVHARAAEQGVRALDAPISGGEQGAIDGTLSIMVGGDADAYADAEPILQVLGSTVARVGGPGAGQTVKAANQLMVAGILGLVSEAIVLLEASGVDPQAALPVLSGGLAGSAVLERKGAAMLQRRFEPGFRVDLHHKDLGIVLDTAGEHQVALPVTGVVAQLLVALRATGRGSLDHSALLALVEELAGRAEGSGG